MSCLYRGNGKTEPGKLPGRLLHRTNPNDVARVKHAPLSAPEKKKTLARPTTGTTKESVRKCTPMYDGVMKGRTMYVIPYSMGPIGSPLAKVGVELTDSIYVVLNMDIMTRMGKQALKIWATPPTISSAACTPKRTSIRKRELLHRSVPEG